MMSVEKRRQRKSPRRAVLILLAALALAAAAGAYFLAQRPQEAHIESQGYEPALIAEKSADEVAEVSAEIEIGEGWTLVQADGAAQMAGDPDFALDAAWARSILDAAAIIEAPAILSENPSDWENLADFGLDSPRAVVRIRYTSGEEITLRIGGAVTAESGSWLYMTVDGRSALYAIDKGTADIFTTSRPLLRAITQPTLHEQRFDRITLTSPGGTVEWALTGAIGDSDALERWRLLQPMAYPADASAMESLRAHIASLRLGAWVAEATAESRARYGFDQPRLTLTVRQAAGDMGAANASGEYEVTPWPESGFTLEVGAAQSEDVDYVLCDGQIYMTSHYSLSALMDVSWRETLSRFPVLTAAGNLRRLTIARGGSTSDYLITRTERVAENNDLVTDFGGSVVYDRTVTLDGAPIAWDAFESAYNQLATATVSGVLPGDFVPGEPHTVFTFEDVDGTVHTIALADFDGLHDAVAVDGAAVFYLVKGGFAWE